MHHSAKTQVLPRGFGPWEESRYEAELGLKCKL